MKILQKRLNKIVKRKFEKEFDGLFIYDFKYSDSLLEADKATERCALNKRQMRGLMLACIKTGFAWGGWFTFILWFIYSVVMNKQ